MGQRSLKVIETGTIRKFGCGFLFAFRNKWLCLALFARQSEIFVENRDFSYPLTFDRQTDKRTDRRTDILPQNTSAVHTRRAVKIICVC